MKYTKLIILSTLLSFSHYAFTGFSAATEWFAYDFVNKLIGIPVVIAWVLYDKINYKEIGTKLISFVFATLCSIEFIWWCITRSHSDWVLVLALLFTLALTLLKAQKWNISAVKGDKLSNEGVYIIFKRPKSFWPWVCSLFGVGVGSCQIIVNGNRYFMSRFFRSFKKAPVLVIEAEFCFKLPIYPNACDSLEHDLGELVGQPFRPITSNCLSVVAPVLKKYGVNVRYLLPSRYAKEFIR